METRIYLALLTELLALAMVMGFCIIMIIRYQRKKIVVYYENLNADINTLEKEKLRIAKDLHDDLGATLSAIKLRLHCLEPDTQENIILAEQAEKYIDEAMLKLKRISFNMMPQILQRRGLKVALDELVDMSLASTRIKVSADYSIKVQNQEIEIHIYRIIQEIITNIIKHANATAVSINITKIENEIHLHIRDNGQGFSKSAVVRNNKGQGLQNIMNRADILNARTYLTAEPGKGVDYLIKIPGK